MHTAIDAPQLFRILVVHNTKMIMTYSSEIQNINYRKVTKIQFLAIHQRSTRLYIKDYHNI